MEIAVRFLYSLTTHAKITPAKTTLVVFLKMESPVINI
jgi:hypothetical protein